MIKSLKLRNKTYNIKQLTCSWLAHGASITCIRGYFYITFNFWLNPKIFNILAYRYEKNSFTLHLLNICAIHSNSAACLHFAGIL